MIQYLGIGVILLIIVYIVYHYGIGMMEERMIKDPIMCMKLQKKYLIKPGETWGAADATIMNKYIDECME